VVFLPKNIGAVTTSDARSEYGNASSTGVTNLFRRGWEAEAAPAGSGAEPRLKKTNLEHFYLNVGTGSNEK